VKTVVSRSIDSSSRQLEKSPVRGVDLLETLDQALSARRQSGRSPPRPPVERSTSGSPASVFIAVDGVPGRL